MDFMNNIKSVFQTTDKIKWMDINKIIINPELESIFIQKENEIANICQNMKERGFDPAHPIILAYSKEHPELNNINADGHTRYKAAIRAGLTKVAVMYKEFTDREELLKFVYEQQLLRRNLSEGEVFNAWLSLNRLKNEEGKKAKTDSVIADELHISRRTVAKMKEVEKKASSELLERIKSGEFTVNKAYTQIKEQEKQSHKRIKSGEFTVNKTYTQIKEQEKQSQTPELTQASQNEEVESKTENSHLKSLPQKEPEKSRNIDKDVFEAFAKGVKFALIRINKGDSFKDVLESFDILHPNLLILQKEDLDELYRSCDESIKTE